MTFPKRAYAMPTCLPTSASAPLIALLAFALSFPISAAANPADNPSFKCPEGQCTDDFPAIEGAEIILEILELEIRRANALDVKAVILGLLGVNTDPEP